VTTVTAEPDDFLPLRPVEFQVLVILRDRDLHGYGILQEAGARGEGSAVPGLVTLYRALQRMEQKGLIQPVADGPPSSCAAGDRRRTYRMTPLGKRVLRAEAVRLGQLVRAALEDSGTGPERAES
jgi:DNA-binding PadR family transcriptional regulator